MDLQAKRRQIPIEFGLYFNHALKLTEAGKLEEAEVYYDKCAAICPEAWLGIASQELRDGCKEQAITRFEQCLKHAAFPKTKAVALNNFAMMLTKLGHRAYARPYFLEAYKLWKHGDFATNIALGYMYEGKLAESKHWMKKALLMDPANHQFRFNAALLHLLAGDFDTGFRDYESRFSNPTSKVRRLSVFRKEWTGQPAKDKTLLIYAEQGVGDTIQMLRYGPVIKPLVGQLHIALQGGLKELAESQGCWDVIYEDLTQRIDSANVPHWDLQLPMMSLPRVLKTTLDTIPPAPYLARWPKPESDKLRTAFVWAGSLQHADDWIRSTNIDQWKDLFAIPGTEWHSMQVGPRTIDLSGDEYPIIDESRNLRTYADSARVLSSMDLLVCVDTSILHLAGAMDIPTFVLLQYAPDWRWMLEREDSPWYPSVRLFRQKSEGQWDPVFERLKNEIQHYRQLQTRDLHCQPA